MSISSKETTLVERRRSAVLSADAKGYSLLMGEDEVGTVPRHDLAKAFTGV